MLKPTLAGLLRLTAALLGLAAGALSANAAQRGELNLGVTVNGISAVSDLAAAPGATVGSINLTWTEPRSNAITPPTAYDIRISSLSQIANDFQFDAAPPLSAFSPSAIPAPGPGGGAAGMVVTGLEPGVTYYFALREYDSAGVPARGVWTRAGINQSNAARARFLAVPPSPITDLTPIITGVPAQVRLQWTSPSSDVKVATYTVVYSTIGAIDLAGDTTAWFNLAVATRAIVAPAKSSGSLESALINALPLGTTVYFGIKSVDIVGQVSLIDVKAAGVVTQARTILEESIEVFASTGAASGSVDLTWDEPFTAGLALPVLYDIRVSTLANIDNSVQADAAAALTVFSSTPAPTPGAGGARITFTVHGLVPGVTHYFAVRLRDSGAPQVVSNWARNVATNLNQRNFAPAHFIPNAPDAVTDLVAGPGAAEGDVALTWTAPMNDNYVPMASYEVRYASFSAASLGGDATAWFALAPNSATVPAQTPGAAVALTVGGLHPLTTWYFALRSLDVRGELSPVDANAAGGVQASTMPRNFAPPPPAGVAAAAGLRLATLSWSDLTPAEKGLAFGFYRLYRASAETGPFLPVSTTTTLSFVDRPLTAFTTYWYRVASWEGPGGLEGVQSSTVSVVPFTLAPQEPFGFNVTPGPTSVSVTWSPTTRFADTTPFFSTGTPAADELQGYSVSRSTSFCVPSEFVQIATMTHLTRGFTDVTLGDSYFYRIRAFNTFAASTATLVLSSLGDMHFFLEDCVSEISIPRADAAILNASSNTFGGDVYISRRSRSEDSAEGVVQSVEFRPLLNGVTELKNFYLPRPARVVLRYELDGSGGVAPLAGPGVAAADPKHLGVFWHNGAEFKKMYGRIDPLAQTLEVESPNLGLYQIRSVFRSNAAVFDISNVSAKVITPNDDGLNDVFIVTYDPGPRNVLPVGRVYDLRGAFVASMTGGLVPNTLTWDGRMNGTAVSNGVYVYQIKGDGKTFNGTIVIAR